MKKFLKKLIAALYEQAWTIAGTILVLITLSGDVQSWGIKISVATLNYSFIWRCYQKGNG